MIRIILIITILVLFLILTIPLALLEMLIGLIHPRLKDISTRKIVQVMFRFFLWLAGTKITAIGKERLPKKESVLFVGNHRSYFDILVTYAHIDRLTGFVAKNTMLKAPLLRTWMKFIHCLFLNREDIRQGMKTINAGAEEIKNGFSMFIFPEGTRGHGKTELDMLDFKEGSLKMAQKADCKIIPVAITGTANIWEKQFPIIKPTKVVLEFGEPILITELEKEDQKHLGAFTQQKILHMLKSHAVN